MPGEKDYCLNQNKIVMKQTIAFIVLISAILVLDFSCKNGTGKNSSKTGEKEEAQVAEGLPMIGKDIITEVIVRPDTMGDPWEVEKVKGFDGTIMFRTLFDRIYKGELTVYDCLIDEPLKADDVRKIEKDFNSDMSRIAKLQFLEDWYFDPATNGIVKKAKSVSFGYEVKRGNELPSGYVALFRVML
jgi:hypothetical protein